MAQPADFAYTVGSKTGSLEGGHRQSGRGVCGNFRFKFYTITNCDNYASIVPFDGAVLFAASTKTVANTDEFGTGKMNVEGTADSNDANQLTDSTATFSSMWSGLAVVNTGDGNVANRNTVKDADELYLFDKSGSVTDTFPLGNEAWGVTNDRYIEMTSAAATYEGYLIAFGR